MKICSMIAKINELLVGYLKNSASESSDPAISLANHPVNDA